MSWYQEFDGGRAFYTAMGHTNETFSEEIFLNHLWAGIHYATGGDAPQPLDYAQARPEENRFSKVVLAAGLDEPMELTLLDEDRVLFIQRKGEVRLYKHSTKEVTTIANIPVSNTYNNGNVAEDGLLGLNKDPNFTDNQWIYMFYSSKKGPKNVLSRFTMDGDELLMDSEIVMLEVGVQKDECCHTGGSIAWDKDGNLYVSTGDNTNPHASDGYSPSDERPGRGPWDAQKSSANTNDLRGKILRIRPQADGSYTIPEGNLFPEGTAKTRPEIYTMGHRNPYRISIDQRTGYLYWGDVGPDAGQPNPTRGPAGHDEVGQARKAGNFGWPHFVGDNKAYHKYDFATQASLEPWDPAAPINTSPNNTGLEELPPAQEAFIWYPYDVSPEFPLTGTGGRNAMAGPVFYSEDFKRAERAFPDYYNGKLFAYDWMRGWIMSVTMDDAGNLASMERFMPSYKFSNPMDMVFSENGDLYMLEYGTGWFAQNDDARLIRIEYNGGNRNPQLAVQADTRGGVVPLTVNLSTEGSMDPDEDALSYAWEITSDQGYKRKEKSGDVALTFDEPGVYTAQITVKDGQGGESNQTIELIAGNEAPVLSMNMEPGNRSFFTPNAPFSYDIQVADAEDGSLGSGIPSDRVALNIDYFPEGYDKIEIAQGHRAADESALYAKGKNLMADSDCAACHKENDKSIGPSYVQVAEKYKEDDTAVELLASKIINGGAGVWGETAMAGHPQIIPEDAAEIVKYILSLGDKPELERLPLKGTYTATLPEGDPGKGTFVIRTAYSDNGAEGLPSLSSEEVMLLRNAQVNPHTFDVYEEVNKMSFDGADLAIINKNGAYMGLEQIDLNGVGAVVVLALAPKPNLDANGGKVELHLDSPGGPLLGTSNTIEPKAEMDFNPEQLMIPIQLPADFDGAMHDVYLVFKNEDAGEGALMVVVGTIFNLTTGGQLSGR
jgi:cytochrome c